MKRKHNKNNINTFGMGLEMYWDRIGESAVRHVGRGDQLKGTVHEVAYCTKRNLKSLVTFSDEVCKLTSSKNAKVVDAIISKNNKITERLQLKDVVSESGVRSVVNRTNNGYYRSAKIIGTKESTTKLAKKSTKRIISSGISSKTNNRIADNQGVNVRDKALLSGNMQDIGMQAGSSALFAAALSVAGETVGSYHDYKYGHISGGEYAGRIIKTTGTNAAKSALKTSSALALKEGTKQLAKAVGKSSLKRVAGSNAFTAVVFGVVEQVGDTAMYMSGHIDSKTYKSNSIQNVGSTGGAVAGAAAGAAMGSIIPGAGTVIGATIGGIVGSIGGGHGLKKLFG